ncbi:2Fe-2S iron-sulfur cluster-binding protein [Scopulibacillus darangshiensis]|uniref:2Fe-2S iron-sulfur cluster-binding protein n=1 Tax=Scopulibacillus darangshiensis TaxID=442528 RepID=UPI001042DB1E
MNDDVSSEEKINEWLDSNLCRCTSYQEIKEALYALLPDVTKGKDNYGHHL